MHIYKTSQDKTSQRQNFPRDKTSQGTKRTKGQDVPGTKRPKGQKLLKQFIMHPLRGLSNLSFKKRPNRLSFPPKMFDFAKNIFKQFIHFMKSPL